MSEHQCCGYEFIFFRIRIHKFFLLFSDSDAKTNILT
jgi:hypothetical protein